MENNFLRSGKKNLQKCFADFFILAYTQENIILLLVNTSATPYES